MDYSCGVAPNLTSSLKRGTSIRRSMSNRRYGYDWEIRSQLCEQLRCMELKVEADTAVLAEIQDFYRRRAAIEQDYSDQLSKLVNTLKSKHLAEQARRQQWPNYTTLTLWNTLVAGTMRVSQAHTVTSTVYAKQMVMRLQDMQEDCQRLFRKCREIAISCQEILLDDSASLQEKMKLYHTKHNDALYAEAKFNQAQNQKDKLHEHLTGKQQNPTDNKKYKQLTEQVIRKFQKYQKAKKETTKARNSYVLELTATNSGVQKYFTDNMPDILDCMACGYHNGLARSIMMHLSCEEALQRVHESLIELLNRNVAELNSRKDKQLFLEKYQSAFRLAHQFQFQAHKDDEDDRLSAHDNVRSSLESARAGFKTELDELKTKTEEDWKTLETVEKSLMSLINQKDYDVTTIFKERQMGRTQAKESVASASSGEAEDRAKLRQSRVEQEEYYLTRFNHYLIDMYRYHTRQSKYQEVQKVLGNDHRPADLPKKLPRRVIRVPMVGKPKLFGGTIDEYVEATKEEIPPILISCIRVLNQYGMHHQGVFRVSGSQAEINEFKASFERGEDPLVDVCDARDINSTAGLLKLYFRELGEPVFPPALFDEFVHCTMLDIGERVERVRKMFTDLLSRPVYVTLRYLFSFLNHLSEMSDDNMMDTYNLAICFGPTLMPVPAERNQVQYQNSVNELIKTIIIHHERIFSREIPGPIYEKNLQLRPRVDSSRDDEIDCSTLSSDRGSRKYSDIDQSVIEESTWDEEDLRSTSESDARSIMTDAEITHAVAQHDYAGRSHRELSFRKSEALLLYRRLNADWWEGRSAERLSSGPPREGLIPEAYITVLQSHTPTTPPPNAFEPGLGSGGAGTTGAEPAGATGDDSSSSGGGGARAEDKAEEDEDEDEEEEADDSLTAAGVVDSDDDLLERDMEANLEVSGTAGTGQRDLGEHNSSDPGDSQTRAPNTLLANTNANNLNNNNSLQSVQSDPGDLSRHHHHHHLHHHQHYQHQGPQPPQEPQQTSVAVVTVPVPAVEPPRLRKEALSGLAASTFAPFSSFAPAPVVSATTDDLSSSQRSVRGQTGPPLLMRRSSDGPAFRAGQLPQPPPLHEDPVGEAEAEEDDFVDDLDIQLQRVMDGLASLEHNSLTMRASHTLDRTAELEQKVTLPTAKHTPDLVLDLPARSPSSSSLGSASPLGTAASGGGTGGSAVDASHATAADTFAEQGGDTLKKSTKTVVAPPGAGGVVADPAMIAAAAAAAASSSSASSEVATPTRDDAQPPAAVSPPLPPPVDASLPEAGGLATPTDDAMPPMPPPPPTLAPERPAAMPPPPPPTSLPPPVRPPVAKPTPPPVAPKPSKGRLK